MCVWFESFNTELTQTLHSFTHTRTPKCISRCEFQAKRDCVRSVQLCGSLLLLPSHLAHVLSVRFKPLAHCLVFHIAIHNHIHIRLFHAARSALLLIEERFRICCIRSSNSSIFSLFCFCSLPTKLIAPWCFSTKRILNRCCCIPTQTDNTRFFFRSFQIIFSR